MSGKKSVLGKGLGALLNTSIATPAYSEIQLQRGLKKNEKKPGSIEPKKKTGPIEPLQSPSLMPLEMIRPNPNQPRRIFNDEQISELASSIKENGIIQPIIVTPIEGEKFFEIIAGERRFRAATLLKLDRVPVVIKKVTQKDKLLMAIIENVQREDLNCVEESLAYFKLMEEFKLTQEQVAKKIGKERSTIANYLRVLKLPKEVIILLQKDFLSFGHAKVLAGVKEKECISLAKQAAAENWSVRVLEQKLKEDPNTKRPSINKKRKSKELDAFKLKLERKTGFHVDIKGNKSKGQILFKYSDKKELEQILEYLMD